MPIHEYRCEPCRVDFEALIRTVADAPACPKCGGIEVTRQLSAPAPARSGSSALSVCNSPMPTGCGGPGPCGSGMCSLN